jgi:thiamine pyrophosphokinase
MAASRCVILCDGGANFLYRSKHRDAANVKAIVGDLDSIEPEVRAYYSSRVEIHDLSFDQDSNDFEKAITFAVKVGLKRIVSLGVLGGRFDQEMCNLNVLQKHSLVHLETDLVAVGKSSVICVVKPEVRTTIRVGQLFVKNQTGLICFGKSRVKTKGFRWNLGGEGLEVLEWGVLVSSSNEILEEEVEITAQKTVFFVAELRQDA